MKLKKYEEICPKCNGNPKLTMSHDSYDVFYTCKYCKGIGKIDWIDKIKLRENNENIYQLWRTRKKIK